MNDYDRPFGGISIVFCGDLRQLPSVFQTSIYKRSKTMFGSECMWQMLDYYPLKQVMRQSEVTFSTILTKIGNGDRLTDEETNLTYSRFVSLEFVDREVPDALRIFFHTADINEFNRVAVQGDDVLYYPSMDLYAGHKDHDQLASTHSKVHKMKVDETGGLPYLLQLMIGKPYMIRTNLHMPVGLVNGAIGTLM
jgi:hypothetical protein